MLEGHTQFGSRIKQKLKCVPCRVQRAAEWVRGRTRWRFYLAGFSSSSAGRLRGREEVGSRNHLALTGSHVCQMFFLFSFFLFTWNDQYAYWAGHQTVLTSVGKTLLLRSAPHLVLFIFKPHMPVLQTYVTKQRLSCWAWTAKKKRTPK